MHPLPSFVLAATLLLGLGQVRAQGVQVAPVVVELAAGQMATTIAVTNTGGAGVTVQVRSFAWEQAGEADRLNPTADIVVSPPITDIGPGETQTFRIVARKAAGPVEVSYRLLVDQIPSSLATTGVQFALRLSLPLFLEPPGRVAPSVDWRITSDGRVATLRGNQQGQQPHPSAHAGAGGRAAADERRRQRQPLHPAADRAVLAHRRQCRAASRHGGAADRPVRRRPVRCGRSRHRALIGDGLAEPVVPAAASRRPPPASCCWFASPRSEDAAPGQALMLAEW